MRKRFYLLSSLTLTLSAGLTWLWFPAIWLLQPYLDRFKKLMETAQAESF